MPASARASRKFPSRSRKKCRTTSASVAMTITPTSTRSARVVEPAAAGEAQQERDHRDAPRRPPGGRRRSRSVGASTWANTGSTSRPNPVTTISRPLRLSGRRRQATRPQPTNAPPTSRKRARKPATGSSAKTIDDERDELGGHGRRPQRGPEEPARASGRRSVAERRRSGGGASPSSRNRSRPSCGDSTPASAITATPAAISCPQITARRRRSRPRTSRPWRACDAPTSAPQISMSVLAETDDAVVAPARSHSRWKAGRGTFSPLRGSAIEPVITTVLPASGASEDDLGRQVLLAARRG